MTPQNPTTAGTVDPLQDLGADADLFADAGGEPIDPQMYDTLMAKINPELTTEGLKTLDAKYKNETPEQAKVRAAAYEKSFAEYDRLAETQLSKMKSASRTYRRQAMQTVEHMERKDEESAMEQMEKAMAAA